MAEHAAHIVDHHAMTTPPTWPRVVLLMALASLYITAHLRQPARKRWSSWQATSWHAGLAVAAVARVGPIASAAHTDFRVHMAGHLLLGMLAPILLVLGAPVTLPIRAMPVARAGSPGPPPCPRSGRERHQPDSDIPRCTPTPPGQHAMGGCSSTRREPIGEMEARVCGR